MRGKWLGQRFGLPLLLALGEFHGKSDKVLAGITERGFSTTVAPSDPSWFLLLWGSAFVALNGGQQAMWDQVGVGQNETTRGPQVLVHVSICQGSILGTIFWPTARWCF